MSFQKALTGKQIGQRQQNTELTTQYVTVDNFTFVTKVTYQRQRPQKVLKLTNTNGIMHTKVLNINQYTQQQQDIKLMTLLSTVAVYGLQQDITLPAEQI